MSKNASNFKDEDASEDKLVKYVETLYNILFTFHIN